MQPIKTAVPAVSFSEIEDLVCNNLPPWEGAPEDGTLGGFGKVRKWLGGKGEIRHPRMALFTASGVPRDTDMLAQLAGEANADLKIYELGTEAGPLTDHEIVHAMAYGMMAVQPGVDLLAVAALREGGIRTEGAFLEALAESGGLDIAAAMGCIIAARLARVPVLVEGPGALAAVAMLKSLNPAAADHCMDAAEILPAETSLQPGAKSALVIPFLKALAKV